MTMELWIVRHAEAEERRLGLADERRALTRRGRRDADAIARGLRRLGVEIERLHHSPLLRSVETAERLAPLVSGETAVSAELARSPSSALVREIADSGARSLAVVGHEPWLSELAFWLITGWRVDDPRPQPEWIDFPKSGVLRLEGEPRPGGMRLAAFHDVRTLRRVRK
jgi:phosphohistidine phosphatase